MRLERVHSVRVHSVRVHWELERWARVHPRLAVVPCWALSSFRRHLHRKPIRPLQRWPRVRSKWLTDQGWAG